jgi:hypothetical protein
VVNPILGAPKGRFYHTGDKHFGHGYQRAEKNPEHAQVRASFDQVLSQYPGLQKDNLYFKSKKGSAFLKNYSSPKSIEKPLYNPRDFKRYDETIDSE